MHGVVAWWTRSGVDAQGNPCVGARLTRALGVPPSAMLKAAEKVAK